MVRITLVTRVGGAPSLPRENPPQNVVDWLASTRGQEAIFSAVRESAVTLNNLNEVRNIKPDQLNEPITC